MKKIELAPGGKLAVGTIADDAGETHVCVDFTDTGAGSEYRLHFELSNFVALADHLASVADELVQRISSDHERKE